MNFAEQMKSLMKELGMTQADVRKLTGIGASSLSQYLSGKHEPPKERKARIAVALGVQEDYFETLAPVAKITKPGINESQCFNVPVPLAARLMGKSKEWLMQGLRDGIFPFGYGVKMNKWSYYISSIKFTEYTGIKIPADVEIGGE